MKHDQNLDQLNIYLDAGSQLIIYNEESQGTLTARLEPPHATPPKEVCEVTRGTDLLDALKLLNDQLAIWNS